MKPPVTRFMIYPFVMWFLTVTSFSTKWRPLVRPLLQLSQTNTARHFNMDQISSQIYCNVELNLAITETLVTLLTCPQFGLEGWVAVDPKYYRYASTETRNEADPTQKARRRPTWTSDHAPALMADFVLGHYQIRI